MNNNTNLFLVAFIGMAFTVGTFLSCKDKNNSTNNPSFPTPSNCDTCHSALEAKDFFAFKQGSFWVYEEETTHERDSMYVTQSWISSGYDFYTEIKSNRDSFNYRYWPKNISTINGCKNINSLEKKCLFVYRNKAKNYQNLGDTRAFFINYFLGDEYSTTEWGSNCYENKVTFIKIKNSFNSGSLLFNKTILINESCSYHYDQQPVNLYYSKGVGIVRKELIDSNQVWNLVKYKIAV